MRGALAINRRSFTCDRLPSVQHDEREDQGDGQQRGEHRREQTCSDLLIGRDGLLHALGRVFENCLRGVKIVAGRNEGKQQDQQHKPRRAEALPYGSFGSREPSQRFRKKTENAATTIATHNRLSSSSMKSRQLNSLTANLLSIHLLPRKATDHSNMQVRKGWC